MKLRNEIILINIASISCLIMIFVIPNGLLRMLLGLPFAVFSPGYLLSIILFQKAGLLTRLERAVIGFGLSIVLVTLGGLLLNLSTWGITLASVLAYLALSIFTFSIIIFFVQTKLGVDEQLEPLIDCDYSGWIRKDWLEKFSQILIVILFASTIFAFVYSISIPRTGEKYTEFYILGMDGKAENYPHSISYGQNISVTLGVINREGESTEYSVEIASDNVANRQLGPLILDNNEKWEQEVSFTPSKRGDNQKIEYLLYKNSSTGPYLSLHLWVDVK